MHVARPGRTRIARLSDCFGSGGNPRVVSHEGLANLWQQNRIRNKNNVLSTISGYFHPKVLPKGVFIHPRVTY